MGANEYTKREGKGAKSGRPELGWMLDALRGDDVVVVTKLPRLSRSVRDQFNIDGRIDVVGAQIKSLKEP